MLSTIRNIVTVTACASALTVFTVPAAADWNPGDPYKMHYPQLPDLSPAGLDVLAGPKPTTADQPYEKFLADDWMCTGSGPVTDIHIWGSYNHDIPLTATPKFSLVIYDNVPAGVDAAYSHPGQPLWSTYVAPTASRVYATANEGFYDPNANQIVGTDTQVWQFNYWLGVHHTFDLDDNGTVNIFDLGQLANEYPSAFGWKTSGSPHFMDDAVFTDVATWQTSPHVVPGVGAPWRDLHHPVTGESLDLAFVITPEPGMLSLAMLGALTLRRRR